MSKIVYREGMNLELRVRDTGLFDGFTVYLNGELFDEIGDRDVEVHG